MNIAECFSLGVPVVSTSIGNAGDLVSKSNAGTLFDFEVKGSFRKALDAVYQNSWKNESKQSRMIIEKIMRQKLSSL